MTAFKPDSTNPHTLKARFYRAMRSKRAEAFEAHERATLPDILDLARMARLDLPAPGVCQWILGTAAYPEVAIFCAEAVSRPGCSYCAEHAAIAYRQQPADAEN